MIAIKSPYWDKQKRALIEENKLLKGFRLLFKQKKPRIILTKEEKTLRKKQNDRNYYIKNKDKKLLQVKNWVKLNKEKRNNYLTKYRKNNIEKEKLKLRLNYWRQKQKQLTLHYLENKPYNLSNNILDNFLPTFHFLNYCQNNKF